MTTPSHALESAAGALGPRVPLVKGRRYWLEIAGLEALDAFAE